MYHFTTRCYRSGQHLLSIILKYENTAKSIGCKIALRWRHNGRDGVSNHQRLYCLLNCLFRHRSKKTSKLRVTGLCAGNSPGIGEFPAQKVSNTENVTFDDVIMKSQSTKQDGLNIWRAMTVWWHEWCISNMLRHFRDIFKVFFL